MVLMTRPLVVVVPTTESAVLGVEVPMPTLPLERTVRNTVPDDEAMVRGFSVGFVEVPWINNVEELAVVLPMSTTPLPLSPKIRIGSSVALFK